MSSSSDCSEDERLREAVDASHCRLFAKDSQNGGVNKEKCSDNKLPSKRREEKTEQFNSELRVTRGFQDYVAKHLDQMIERRIKYSKGKKKLTVPDVPDGGVHLFSTSEQMLKVEDEHTERQMPKRRKLPTKAGSNDSSSSSDDDEKLKEAAVSSEWILDKKSAY